MSDAPRFINPRETPDGFEWFAFVVDGEVAWSEPVPIQEEAKIAALLSGVQAVRLAGDERFTVISGYGYTDGVFTPPTV
jgi:hypothetical protein